MMLGTTNIKKKNIGIYLNFYFVNANETGNLKTTGLIERIIL